MIRADIIRAAGRMPNAAWAWEGLRRNPSYRRDYFATASIRPIQIRLATGATLLRAKARELSAEKWGLVTMADPRNAAINANVFWKPDVLAGSLEVRLSPLSQSERDYPDDHDIISLAHLQTRRVLLESVDGARHILLNGKRFWIQLHCPRPSVVGELAHLGIRMNQTTFMKRRIDTTTQLLSLYRSRGGKLQLIGRRRNTKPLQEALTAYDIWTGFERPKGGLRDIAIAIYGQERVNKEWSGSSRYMKDQAVRSRNKGLAFVERDYRDLLTKKEL